MEKRDKILLAALELLVEKGFHATPTSLIAKKAEVANGTLFHYFKSKEELINSLYIDIKHRFFKQTLDGYDEKQSLKSRIRWIWLGAVRWSQDYPLEFKFLQQYTNSPYLNQLTNKMVEEYHGFYQELIKEGINEGLLKDLPIDLIHALSFAQVDGLSKYLLQNPDKANNMNFIESSFDLHWDCIRRH